ncbi:MAG: hypothetical protein CFE28_14315 [Alphaproteobacteria bacterium PA2]|nr:MAG: hypothetical protein CFE28_14315 [Alphaproteobacteria bacterium PA2]
MATGSGAFEKLDIGRVFQTTFGIIRRNMIPLAILGIVLDILPSALSIIMKQKVLLGIEKPESLPTNMAIAFVTMCFATVFQAASIHVTIADLNGRSISVAEALRRSVKLIIPLIGIGVMLSIAIGFGILLLIVPGLMVACAFAVAVPARVVEGIPANATLDRSRYLTRGNRWRIFWLGGIWLIMLAVFEAAVIALSGNMQSLPNLGLGSAGIATLVVSFVIGVVSTVTISVLYFELRRIKDGVGATDLATVFD